MSLPSGLDPGDIVLVGSPRPPPPPASLLCRHPRQLALCVLDRRNAPEDQQTAAAISRVRITALMPVALQDRVEAQMLGVLAR